MSLSINPQQYTKISSSSLLSAASNSGGSLQSQNFTSLKTGLDNTVNRLGGGVGTPLNGATAGAANLGTALNGAGSSVQSIVSSAGDVAGAVANAAATIGAGANALGIGGSIGGIAGSIASAAGQLNNVLSLFRAKSLPAAGELFQKQGATVQVMPAPENDWRVRINCNFGLFGQSFSRLENTQGFVWPFTPKVSIATRANYTAIDPTHSNYPFQAYKSSAVEDITIGGEFSCETEEDAAYWIEGTTFFKTATKMFFGNSQYSGNPPIVCQLSGYGPGILNQIPVVIKSFQIDLNDDINYIKVNAGVQKFNTGPTWVPILSTISVTVSPIYNRTLLRKFSLQDYADGKAIGYI